MTWRRDDLGEYTLDASGRICMKTKTGRSVREKTPTPKQSNDQIRRELFVKALAMYLAGNQAEMGIRLQMRTVDAKAWATLRSTTPLFGYPSVEEAEQVLREFLRI